MISRILDRGSEFVWIYPEVLHTDARGNRVRIPSDTPVKVRVSTSEDRSSDAELPGQVQVKAIRCIARSAPVTTWARVDYDGESWDLAGPPRFSKGTSRVMRHVEFTLRSRNYSAKAQE